MPLRDTWLPPPKKGRHSRDVVSQQQIDISRLLEESDVGSMVLRKLPPEKLGLFYHANNKVRGIADNYASLVHRRTHGLTIPFCAGEFCKDHAYMDWWEGRQGRCIRCLSLIHI